MPWLLHSFPLLLSSRFSYFPIIVCVPAGSKIICHVTDRYIPYTGKFSRVSIFTDRQSLPFHVFNFH